MPLVNTVEHRESTSSSHQTAVNGRWSEPKTSHSSSSKFITNADTPSSNSNNNNNGINYTSRRSDTASPAAGFSSSSYNPPPPPLLPRSTLGGGSVAASQAAEDMERRSRELEQDFWTRVNESRNRLGFTAGGPGDSKFTSSIGAPLRTTSPAPPQTSSQSYRSTSSASSAYNNNNNNSNGYNTHDTFSRKPFDNANTDMLPSHFRTTPSSLINTHQPLVHAFPDNLDDITKHTKDLAVQGIESNIEDLPNGLKLMRWGFDVQGFEPHEIHVKTVGDEQLEIHGKHEEKSGGYSNYAEFTKSVSLPPNTRFDEMRSVFDTRSQRLSVEAPFKPLRMQTAGAIDFHDSGIHDSGYGNNNNYRATPPPTTNYNNTSNSKVSDRYMSNIPIGLSAKQRESYRSTTSSSSSSSRNNINNTKYDYSVPPRTTTTSGPYINTGAIERSSSAHTNRSSGGLPSSRSPMGVRFEDEDRYTSSYARNNGTNIPVRYESSQTSAAKQRFLSNNDTNNNNVSSHNTYDYGRTSAQQPPVVKTTTEYSRRVHESTLNETRPVVGSSGYDSSRRIGYNQPLSNDRMDVRVESVGE